MANNAVISWATIAKVQSDLKAVQDKLDQIKFTFNYPDSKASDGYESRDYSLETVDFICNRISVKLKKGQSSALIPAKGIQLPGGSRFFVTTAILHSAANPAELKVDSTTHYPFSVQLNRDAIKSGSENIGVVVRSNINSADAKNQPEANLLIDIMFIDLPG